MSTSKNKRLATILFVDTFGDTALMRKRKLGTILFADRRARFTTNGSDKNLEDFQGKQPRSGWVSYTKI